MSPWFGGTMLAAGFPALRAAGGGPWFDQPKGGRGGQPAQANGVSGASAGKEKDLWAKLKENENDFSMQGKVTNTNDKSWNALPPVNYYDKDTTSRSVASDVTPGVGTVIGPEFKQKVKDIYNEPYLQNPNLTEQERMDFINTYGTPAYQTAMDVQKILSGDPNVNGEFTPGSEQEVLNILNAAGVVTPSGQPFTVEDLAAFQQKYFNQVVQRDANGNPIGSAWLVPPGSLPSSAKTNTGSGGYPKTWWGYGGGGGGGGGGGYGGGGSWQDYLMNLTTWRGL